MIRRHIRVAVALRSFARKPRGQVFVTVSLALVALMGISALAVDVGHLWTTRRLMQNAADAAAMAGADEVAIGGSKRPGVAAPPAAPPPNGFTHNSPTFSISHATRAALYPPPP